MKKQFTHISVIQTSKVAASLTCIISLIYSVPLGLYEIIANKNYDYGVAFLLQPLINLLLSFITSVVACFIYNQITKILGGVEITIEDVNK